ncbi:retrotransposon-related protein [Tanacetum coccineum]
MVNTRNNVPVLDETLRATVLQVIQEANVPVNATLTILQTNMTTLTDRIEALMLFQIFSTRELTRLSSGEGTSNRGGGYGRLTKLDFPRFNREDVTGWLFRVHQFFLIDNVQENQKIKLVSMHLYDKVLEWHKQFLKIHGENVLWIDYKKEILARFSSVFEDLMVELKNFKQEGEVKVYQEQFEVLLNRLDLTEMQEATLALTKTKHVSQYVGTRTNSHAYANRHVAPVANVNKLVLALPSSSTETVGKVVKSGFKKQLSQKELEEKRAKDDIDEVEEVCDGIEVREENQVEEYTESFPQICLHALSGVNTYQIIRVKGYVGKQALHILIDCGSTHNFLDVSAAKKLPCQLTPTIPLRVDVANRSRMVSSSECKKFKWALQGNEYEADCMLIPLGGYDMGKQTITEGQWKQAQLSSTIVCVYLVHLMHMQGNTVGSSTDNVPLQNLLTTYEDVFAMPTDLPLQRSHDHAINLLPNTPPVTVRPYRLPPNQKDAVEQMVKELLAAGVIRENKFPIPMVEELIDELCGAQVFSKLDLRSRYHQIRMKEEDIYKTTFRTHQGHYEFLVIPFGLTNAPSTFQSLMNQAVLEVMRTHTLYAKQSKCNFLAPHVEYLGHVLSSKGVATDPLKIQAMAAWPIPQTIEQLKGFLGLTGYYRRFIKNYALISQSLTKLLKKNGFHWSEAAEIAFTQLKKAMMSFSVLELPNFEKEFVVETNASGTGIGVVLHQDSHPIAYLSKALAPRHQALPTYEKEFLAVIMALDKWKGYLLDRHFKIKTDHFSLKYLLDQRLTTPFQTKWLPKLLGFDYEISYKKGSKNEAADALSRCSELNATIATTVTTDLLKRIQDSWTQDQSLHSLIQKFQVNPNTPSKFTWQANQLTRKGKLVVGDVPELKDYLFTYVHATSIGGHSGVTVTLQNLKAMVYWKGMRKWVKNKVRSCDVCQRNKPDLSAYPGYLQPLPIPPTIWSSVSMDFIEGLPSSQGKTVIFVVVDRLSKYAYFMALHHPFTASTVAQVFMDNVFKLHGLPHSIFSDRDKWLSLAQYWYNTNFHTSTNLTPFEAVYDQPPPTYVPYETGDSPMKAVDRTDRQFDVGIWVYVKLQPHRQVTMRKASYNKLSSKYYGPFQIVKRIGQVAYELALPATSQIHNVFHVSQLKKCTHSVAASGALPGIDSDGLLIKTPIAILYRKLGKVKNSPVMYVLVQWSGEFSKDATWEIYGDLITRFPSFDQAF